MAKELLVVLMKAPVLGVPKSRIAAEVGAERALEIYESLLKTLFQQITELEAVELWISPAAATESVRRWIKPGWEVRPQCDGDLGARIAGAFESAFARGAESVVVIGSDCPDVTVDDLATAHAKLREIDVVLGPSADGGYWLVGLNRPNSKLFEGIPWSTDQVCVATEERAHVLGLKSVRLGVKRDIDTLVDWVAWQGNRG